MADDRAAYAGVRETDCLILAKAPAGTEIAAIGTPGGLVWKTRRRDRCGQVTCNGGYTTAYCISTAAMPGNETDAVGTLTAVPGSGCGLYIYNGARPSERYFEWAVQAALAAVWFSGTPAFARRRADGGRDLLRTAWVSASIPAGRTGCCGRHTATGGRAYR